jgi:hypothetical protein
VEAQQRIAEFERGFCEAHEKVQGLFKEIGELKTTVRERIVVPQRQVPAGS